MGDRGLITEATWKPARKPDIITFWRLQRGNGKAEELLRQEVSGKDPRRACKIHLEEAGDTTRRFILCLGEKTRED